MSTIIIYLGGSGATSMACVPRKKKKVCDKIGDYVV
jgi:hypothetical protein